MTPGTVDPRIFTGPFSDVLTQPRYEPPGAREFSGLGGTREGLLKMATDFLGGVSKGRLQKFQEGENKKAQALGAVNAHKQIIDTHPLLTDEAKAEWNQGYMKYLGGKASQELQAYKPDHKTPQGAVLNVLKQVVSNLVGVPPKGADLDNEAARSLAITGAAMLKDPRKLKQTYVNEGQADMGLAVREATEAAKSEGRIVTREDIQQHPKFQAGIRTIYQYGGAEGIDFALRSVLGGVPSVGSKEHIAAEDLWKVSEAKRKEAAWLASQRGATLGGASVIALPTTQPPASPDTLPDPSWMRGAAPAPTAGPPMPAGAPVASGNFIPEVSRSTGITGTGPPPVGDYRRFLPAMTPAEWRQRTNDTNLQEGVMVDARGTRRRVYKIPGGMAHRPGIFDVQTGEQITEPLFEPAHLSVTEKVAMHNGKPEYVKEIFNHDTKQTTTAWTGTHPPPAPTYGADAEARRQEKKDRLNAAVTHVLLGGVTDETFQSWGFMAGMNDAQKVEVLLKHGKLKEALGPEYANLATDMIPLLRQKSNDDINAQKLTGAEVVTKPGRLPIGHVGSALDAKFPMPKK